MATAVTLIMTVAAADAQTIGFKLGASLSTLSFDGSSDGVDTRTGFVGGGFIRMGFGRVGIQPEIFSVTKGAEIEGGSVTGADLEIGIEYIAIPVLLHVPLTWGQSFAPYVFGGPELAIDIGCEQTIAGTDVDCDDPTLGEDVFERKSTDFGITAGAGLAFAMGPGALLLEGRYTWGLTNINDNAGTDQSEVKNRSALFLAGYSIPLGSRY
jgi:hypothetical protein